MSVITHGCALAPAALQTAVRELVEERGLRWTSSFLESVEEPVKKVCRGLPVRRATLALFEAKLATLTTSTSPAPPLPDVLERLERLFGASGLTGEQVFERLEALIAKLDQLDALLARSIERAGGAAKAA